MLNTTTAADCEIVELTDEEIDAVAGGFDVASAAAGYGVGAAAGYSAGRAMGLGERGSHGLSMGAGVAGAAAGGFGSGGGGGGK